MSRAALGGRAAALALAATLTLVGCAPVPRPAALGQADAIAHGPAAADAQRWALPAHAEAEKLRREAAAAFDAGDVAGAQITAERAIAAYEHAAVLARAARAKDREVAAAHRAEELETSKAGVEADLARVTADIAALDQRIKALTELEAPVPSGPADAAREQARREAARALAVQARVLCTGARLVLASNEGKVTAPLDPSAAPPEPAALLDAAEADLKKLDDALAGKGPTPIDLASRARAGCLASLTSLRRSATPAARAPGAADALLAELSAMGSLAPSRDDRGVFVTLRGVFQGAGLSHEGARRLADLGKVAAAHPRFPVTVVLHEDREGRPGAASAQLDVVTKALGAAGATRVSAVAAGAALPVVDPSGHDRARNARVEVVFVAPESL